MDKSPNRIKSPKENAATKNTLPEQQQRGKAGSGISFQKKSFSTNNSTNGSKRNKSRGSAGVSQRKPRRGIKSTVNLVTNVSKVFQHASVKDSSISNSIRDSRCALRLPRKVRLQIWNYLSLLDQLTIRLTCRVLKKDIDRYIGVKVELDDVDESFPHLIKIGIRAAIILDILTIPGKFLQHPELLRDITILGGIQESAFYCIMKDCRNIKNVSILFNKDVLAAKPKLFPVWVEEKIYVDILPRLKTLELQANTKNDGDLEYVKNIFFDLVQNHVLRRLHPRTLRVTIVHKFFSSLIEQCSELMSALVYDNNLTLQDLELEIKYLSDRSTLDDSENSNNDLDEVDPLESFFNMDSLILVEGKQPGWQNFRNLKNLHFCVNVKEYHQHWKNLGEYVTFLESLYCEIRSPVSWTYYKSFIKQCESTLETVILEATYYYQQRRPRPIDLTIFKRCQQLESLFISQGRLPGVENSKVKNVNALPHSLEDIELEYLILTPCQVFQLIASRNINHLRLCYWSSSDFRFGQLLWLLRWAYPCGCASIIELVIVDLKIRFQHNKKRLQVLLKSNMYQCEYSDFNETMLVLRKNGH